MNFKKDGRFSRYFSILVIIFMSAILLTWQITYNFVNRKMQDKYSQMLSEVTQSSDISQVMYSVDNIIRNKYYGQIDNEKLVDYTIQGYIYGLGDKYASYMTSEEYDEYLVKNLNGVSVGIGVTAVFDLESEGLYIISVYDDTPAFDAGVLPGEVITKIDGKNVIELGSSLSFETIKAGGKGSVVNLSIKDSIGAERILSLTLEEIKVATVKRRMVSRDTGLIQISEFTDTTPSEFKNAIRYLTVLGAEKFIFDVRNNPGGNLQSIVEILDFILPAGKIITINNKNGISESEVSDVSEFSAPIAVLVNGNTASAAELFTAALRDYDKAEIVGTTTYGKGTVQELIALPNGGVASVSVSTYIPPCGVSYDGIGIEPDYVVELSAEIEANLYKIKEEDDLQLQKALEILKPIEANTYQ